MSDKTRSAVKACVIAALLGATACAQAAESDWTFRLGGHYIDPKSNNHPIVNVGSAQAPTFDLTYHYSPHLGFELLAAVPFKHDINLNGSGTKVADVKQLPPTLSVQYTFLPYGRFRPYAGVGLNGTIFFDAKTTGPLAGQKLSLGNSFGLATQVGADLDLANGWFMNLDARWIDIGTEAHLAGASLGTVHVNPLAFGLSVGHRFGPH